MTVHLMYSEINMELGSKFQIVLIEKNNKLIILIIY